MNVLSVSALGDLLDSVQTQRIFADQKTFVDTIPKYGIAEILHKYNAHKHTASFDLKQFVAENFDLPFTPDSRYHTKKNQNIVEHIQELWDVLTRTDTKASGTLIPLPYPFVVPGGRFGEIYYWDSYFTMLGLQVSGKTDLIQNMVDNFTYLIETIGHIPNGNRSYFLSRSQPPFYSHMIQMLKKEKGDIVLMQYLPALLKEYNYWMEGGEDLSENMPAIKHVVRLEDGNILNRYWDAENKPRPEGYVIDLKIQAKAPGNTELFRHIRAACESGWDFSSRWFADGKNIETICTTDIIPIDLNCLMWHLEKTIAEAYAKNGNVHQQKTYDEKASLRKAAINKYLWNAEKKIYQDFNYPLKQPTNSIHLAMAYPLFIRIASHDRANAVLSFIRNSMQATGGLLTTTEETNQQWDAPRGWAPLQWIVFKSALDYGNSAFAKEIKTSWCGNVERVFASTGKLLEKYIVTDDINKEGGGEYPNQDGFGWTNGVYMAMALSGK